MNTVKDDIEKRKKILFTIKTEIIQRLNISKEPSQTDDDTALFGNGLRLDSVDATEIVVMLDKVFNVQVSESDDPSYMRTINSSFIIKKKQ